MKPREEMESASGDIRGDISASPDYVIIIAWKIERTAQKFSEVTKQILRSALIATSLAHVVSYCAWSYPSDYTTMYEPMRFRWQYRLRISR